MKLLTSGIIVLASAGLLLLGACSKETKTSDSASPNAATPSAETAPPATTTSPIATTTTAQSSEGGKSNKGGQVVESGKYHFEFVPEQGTSKTHLDLYLQKGDTHEAIANAKVTADVQSPDGKLKTIPLSYDASGKHYAAVVSDKTAGQYQVKVTATIGSDKADGRFNFTR
jgi:hypothetical protein